MQSPPDSASFQPYNKKEKKTKLTLSQCNVKHAKQNLSLGYKFLNILFFLYYFLHSFWINKLIIALTIKSAQSNINLGHVKNFDILIPPLPEQKQIASILSDADAKIDALRAHREKLVALKASLIETLLDPGTANA